jgi:hypothetical protein
MGEAVDTVKGNGSHSSRVPRSKTFAKGSVLSDLTNIMDRLDRAKEVKQDDLDQEGRGALAENHAKLGLLQAAGALVRRARALLEDYGGDLNEDIAADLVDGLGDDLKALHPANVEDGVDDAPFGQEDLPDWAVLGANLRDPDDDGPWKITDLDFETGRISLDDQRTSPDGSPFVGGMQLDSIAFDDLAPEGEWCPFDCGHSTTTDDGSCAECGVAGVSVDPKKKDDDDATPTS